MGRFLAAMPVAVVMGIARVFGSLVFHCMRSRRRVVLSNLHHAFPEKDLAWHRGMAVESCRRTVEMALFVLASPYFSKARIRRLFKMDASLREGVARPDTLGEPGVILVPHFSLMEALPLVRVYFRGLSPELELGVFYRPFDNAGLERWVKTTRERHGVRLLSRKEGFGGAVDILRRNGRVVVLFDQHAGKPGALSLFMGRLVSTSELAGLLAEKYGAKVLAFYVERTGFWRGIVKSELVTSPDGPRTAASYAHTVTIAANIWLEQKMRGDDNMCADWLWLHKRWKIGTGPSERFTRRAWRRDVLRENIAALGLDACPRKERFWIRLPEQTTGALQALPVVRALREARPDAEVTLMAGAATAPILEVLGVAEAVITLPTHRPSYWRFFQKLRGNFPDVHVVLEATARAEFEAWLAGAPQRFGMARSRVDAGRWLLTHRWTPPRGFDRERLHRTREWECWWQTAHKLSVAADFSAMRLIGAAGSTPLVGLLLETGVDQWPARYWHALISHLRKRHGVVLRLVGPARQKTFADALAGETPGNNMQNWVGKMDVLACAKALAECFCVVGCDGPGLHLANLLSVPVIGLYGLANPLRTGPVFEAPRVLMQPEGCPPTGGMLVSAIPPDKVALACEAFL